MIFILKKKPNKNVYMIIISDARCFHFCEYIALRIRHNVMDVVVGGCLVFVDVSCTGLSRTQAVWRVRRLSSLCVWSGT